MAKHAPLGASSFYRAQACPASVLMSEGMPNESSVSAEKGTRAHALSEATLRTVLGGNDGADVYESEQARHAMLEILDPSEVESYDAAVDLYVDWVLANFDEAAGDILVLEDRVTLAPLNPPIEMFGTSDAVIVKPAQRRLIVGDAKFGTGYVHHIGNTQTQYYGLGALLKYGQHYQIDVVETVIVQPRTWPESACVPRGDVYTAAELRVDFAAEALRVAHAVLDPNAPVAAGDHCTFCPARPRCPAQAEVALKLAQDEFGDAPVFDPRLIGEAQALALLDRAEQIEGYIGAVRGWAHSRLSKGEQVPGWMLKPKRPTRVMNTTEAEFVEKMTAAGVAREKLYKPPAPEMRTIAQIEKAGLTKDQKAVLATLNAAVSSGYNLVRDDGTGGARMLSASDEFSADL